MASKEELNSFFNIVLKTKPMICIECGCVIYAPTRANCAHILPKQIFKSVATNLNNWIPLCLQHHSDFDSSYSKAMKMKCWPIALQKYKLFKEEVQETHKFLNYLNNE